MKKNKNQIKNLVIKAIQAIECIEDEIDKGEWPIQYKAESSKLIKVVNENGLEIKPVALVFTHIEDVTAPLDYIFRNDEKPKPCEELELYGSGMDQFCFAIYEQEQVYDAFQTLIRDIINPEIPMCVCAGEYGCFRIKMFRALSLVKERFCGKGQSQNDVVMRYELDKEKSITVKDAQVYGVARLVTQFGIHCPGDKPPVSTYISDVLKKDVIEVNGIRVDTSDKAKGYKIGDNSLRNRAKRVWKANGAMVLTQRYNNTNRKKNKKSTSARPA